MNKQKLLSIVVPVFNAEKYLPKCIESLVNQTYKNIEIILVNDGSSDNSPDICDEYAKSDNRIIVIHKANGGASSARNVGLNVCKGYFIGFIDSDDYVELNMFEKMVSIIADDKRTIASTLCALENEDGVVNQVNWSQMQNIESKEHYIESLLVNRSGSSVCTKLFNREIIGKTLFRENRSNEDLLFMFDIEKRFNTIKYTDDVGYHYIIHPNSTSHSFGKAFYDMVGNAHIVKCYVEENYPQFIEQAEYFEFHQNMSFLWNVPIRHNMKKDKMYIDTKQYIKKHFFTGFFNNYLSYKDRIKLLILLTPKFLRNLLKNKDKRYMKRNCHKITI